MMGQAPDEPVQEGEAGFLDLYIAVSVNMWHDAAAE